MPKAKTARKPETVALTPFSKLLQDENNANRGTKRGGQVISKSLKEFGAGRSVLLDKNNRLIAGNKTLGQAAGAKSGIKGVRIIETDGTELIAVKRMDLDLTTDVKAKGLAIADNRAGELSLEWDTDVLKGLSGEVDLTKLWDTTELNKMFAEAKPLKGMEQKSGLEYRVIVECTNEAHQALVVTELEAKGFKCQLLIS